MVREHSSFQISNQNDMYLYKKYLRYKVFKKVLGQLPARKVAPQL